MTTPIPERTNPFPLRLRLVWNKVLVMDALCSSVVAFDVARQHLADNFTGINHTAFVAHAFEAGALDRLLATSRMDIEWTDSTGHARAIVEPV